MAARCSSNGDLDDRVDFGELLPRDNKGAKKLHRRSLVSRCEGRGWGRLHERGQDHALTHGQNELETTDVCPFLNEGSHREVGDLVEADGASRAAPADVREPCCRPVDGWLARPVLPAFGY